VGFFVKEFDFLDHLNFDSIVSLNGKSTNVLATWEFDILVKGGLNSNWIRTLARSGSFSTISYSTSPCCVWSRRSHSRPVSRFGQPLARFNSVKRSWSVLHHSSSRMGHKSFLKPFSVPEGQYYWRELLLRSSAMQRIWRCLKPQAGLRNSLLGSS
jgi:hypothetical protein